MPGYVIPDVILVWDWCIVPPSYLVSCSEVNKPSEFLWCIVSLLLLGWCLLWYSEYWCCIMCRSPCRYSVLLPFLQPLAKLRNSVLWDRSIFISEGFSVYQIDPVV